MIFFFFGGGVDIFSRVIYLVKVVVVVPSYQNSYKPARDL